MNSSFLLLLMLILLGVLAVACVQMPNGAAQQELKALADETYTGEKIEKSEREWKDQLTETEYEVAREHGTERPFTGKYWDNKQAGAYLCICCDLPLFSSGEKFRSGTGWPSFYDVVDKANVAVKVDRSYGMIRKELLCGRCDAHLGHVFKDGPRPTNLRYCINSASLKFVGEKG